MEGLRTAYWLQVLNTLMPVTKLISNHDHLGDNVLHLPSMRGISYNRSLRKRVRGTKSGGAVPQDAWL